METEQNIREFPEHMGTKQKQKPISAPTSASDNASDCFDCNICLDSAIDPIVTLCGHLYCWPCIYKWLNVQNTPVESKCPVCKTNISNSSLIPLYGRGGSFISQSKRPNSDLIIPRRPQALGGSSMAARRSEQLQSYPFVNHESHVGPASSLMFSPTVWIFGEMVFARMFGRSDTSLFAYRSYQDSGGFAGNGSPRMRRQEMQLEKSLNRVSIFLLCCFLLCLLLF